MAFVRLSARALALAACFAVLLVPSPAGAVIDGTEDTTNVYDNVGLWQLKFQGQWFGFCTGTLVAENVVLTAAHCMDFFDVPGGLPSTDLRHLPTRPYLLRESPEDPQGQSAQGEEDAQPFQGPGQAVGPPARRRGLLLSLLGQSHGGTLLPAVLV